MLNISNQNKKPLARPLANNTFADAVQAGLINSLKSLPSQYLYDDIGSELFVQITQLEEYYLSRCEKEIFECQSKEIAAAIKSPIERVVELGCGDGFKTEILLEAILTHDKNAHYAPVDISSSAMKAIQDRMQRRFPALAVTPYVTDYDSFLQKAYATNSGVQLMMFLGSNIGNFTPSEAHKFLQNLQNFMCDGDYLLLGMDLKKSIELLHAAYNDRCGVTRRFNLNILQRMNRELGANFSVSDFSHHGFYNPTEGAMQSFLVANSEQNVDFDYMGISAKFDVLEPLHVENSYKYSRQDIYGLAESCGLTVEHIFSDSKDYFVDVLLRKS